MKTVLTVFAAAIAIAAGAFEWDFTKGLPEGGRLRACAVLGPDGYRSTAADKLPIEYWIDWVRLWQKDGEEIRFPEKEKEGK